jgi:hypothetical protein
MFAKSYKRYHIIKVALIAIILEMPRHQVLHMKGNIYQRVSLELIVNFMPEDQIYNNH